MKTLSATSTAIVAVVLVCALSTGGQQQSEKGQKQTPGFIPVAPKRKTPATHEDARPIAHLPDGRVVRFPARWDDRGNPISTSQEEIDALVKRIAEDAVELPPGARVIGWEPVEGPFLYEARVATIPTTKGKLDALANAVSILQTQISGLQSDVHLADSEAHGAWRRADYVNSTLHDEINAVGSMAANADNRLLLITNQLDDLKRELDKFKEVACPILRTANAGSRTRMELDSACGLH